MQKARSKLGIVVLAYHRPGQLAILLEALQHPQVTIYLHIDSRVDIVPFRSALAAARVRNIVWLPRHRSGWGSLELVDAELEGISHALADGCYYILLISGEDFPLKRVDEIVAFAQANRDRSFVETFCVAEGGWPRKGRERTEFYAARLLNHPYPCVPFGEDTSDLRPRRKLLNWGLRARFLLKPPRRFPDYLSPFGGSQWLNLSAEAAAHVLRFVRDHADYRDYHTHTACPDELFVQSILRGSDFADGHEIVNDDLRLLVWEADNDHPKTLRLENLPTIAASLDLFARKVVASHDPQLFAMLRERIGAGVPAEPV